MHGPSILDAPWDNVALDAVRDSCSSAPSSPEGSGCSPTRNNVPQIIEHEITPADTLVGLSLRYDVEVSELRRLNGIHGDGYSPLYRITLKKKIKVPTTRGYLPADPRVVEAILQRKKIRRFESQVGGARVDEARFYLEETGWNFKDALEQYVQDVEWEHETEKDEDDRKKASASRSSTLSLAKLREGINKLLKQEKFYVKEGLEALFARDDRDRDPAASPLLSKLRAPQSALKEMFEGRPQMMDLFSSNRPASAPVSGAGIRSSSSALSLTRSAFTSAADAMHRTVSSGNLVSLRRRQAPHS